MKKVYTSALAVLAVGTAMMAPSMASAQSWSSHRQSQKNQWKDLAIGAGALGVIGALTHNDGLTLGGLAGALYSGYRYDQDGRYHDYNRYDRDRDRNWNRDRNRRGDGDHDRDDRSSHRHGW